MAEIALTKSFVLAEYVPGLENLFRFGKEIEVFHDKDELLQKVKYYLANDDERERIAKRGYKRAVNDYDKNIIMPRVMKDIYSKYERVDWNKRKNEKLGVYFNDNFKKLYCTFRFRYIFYFLSKSRFDFVKQEFSVFREFGKFSLRIFLYYVSLLGAIRCVLASIPPLKKLKKKFLP